MEYEFTSRYEALGVPLPDPETMCKGQCEGLGVYPHKVGESGETLEERMAWLELHNAPDAHPDEPCDGFHFIKCPDCKGTGLAASEATMVEVRDGARRCKLRSPRSW